MSPEEQFETLGALSLAQVVESALLASEPYPESRPALDFLIERSPEAKALFEELTRPREGAPTLLALARLLNVVDPRPHPDCYGTLLWLVRQSEEGSRVWAELEELARDGGDTSMIRRWPIDALEHRRQLDKLMAYDGWTDPLRFLDPARTHTRATAFGVWINLLLARLQRGEGDAEKIRATLARLEECAHKEEEAA